MKQLFKNILIIFIVIFCAQNIYAKDVADNNVRGKVFSESDGGLIMVNVVEIDQNNRIVSSATTDASGNFSMKIKSKANKLKVSYIGYKTQILSISERKVFNIQLVDMTNLTEITVQAQRTVNTGTMDIKKREVTMAMQTLSNKDFVGLSVSSVDDALQGQISGLDIVGNSGDAGSGSTMRIRGVTSINSGSAPLIVVNGIPFETPAANNFDFASANQENFADLLSVNVDDIESITVLKDAASTAVWGSKGANGVISINTKKGLRGPTKIQYTYRFSGATQPQGMTMLSGDDYTMLIKQAYFNPRQSDAASTIREFNYDPNFSEYQNYNNNTDWIKSVTQFGITHDHYLQLSGGGEKARFIVSGGYYDQTCSVIGQKLQRYSTRMNLDYLVSDRIKFSSEFSFTYTDNPQNYDGLLGIAYKKMPNISIYTQDAIGNNTNQYYKMLQNASPQLSDQIGLRNPVASANLAINDVKSYRIIPTFRIQYDLLDPQKQMLRYKGVVSFDVNNGSTYKFLPKELSTATWLDGSINLSEGDESRNLSISSDHNLTWQPKFSNTDHSLMLYSSFQLGTSSSRYQQIISYGNTNGKITSPTAGGYLNNFATGPGSGRWLAYMFMGHYAYKSKYIADITVRRDGSTKYGENRRWGTFPGVSLAWNIADENFMKPTNHWLSTLKLRPSWGMTGNQPQYEYLFYSLYNSYSSYMDVSTIRPSNIQLTDLRWEKVTSLNLGADLGLLEDNITMDFNYFYKRTEDMLFPGLVLPTSSGYSSLSYLNAGTMDNEGWEINFRANKFVKIGKFSMDFNLNLSNNVNTIVSLKPEVLASLNTKFSYQNGKYLSRVQENNAYGSIYGFRFKGVYQYSDFVDGRVGTSPYAFDEDQKVIRDSKGEPIPMYFAYGTNTAYKFKGGDAIYEDINHDGNINELDIVYLGNSNPLLNGGMGLKLNYKQLSVNIFSNFRIGNKIVNMARMNAENMYTNNNQSASVNWRWRKDGDLTTMPRALYQTGFNWLGSDRYVEDGSFLRVKYVQINYSIPTKSLKRFLLNQMIFYVTVNNLITFTKYSGVDPEVGYGSLGVSQDNNQTPRSNSFTAGISIGF
jgi:TonB-linked SusC/RagA family outer membrane protein